MKKSGRVFLIILASLAIVYSDAISDKFTAQNDGGEDDWK